jgi:hypothetical protein
VVAVQAVQIVLAGDGRGHAAEILFGGASPAPG